MKHKIILLHFALFFFSMEIMAIHTPDTTLNLIIPAGNNKPQKATGYIATLLRASDLLNRDSIKEGIHLMFEGMRTGEKEIRVISRNGYFVTESFELITLLCISDSLRPGELTLGYAFMKTGRGLNADSVVRLLDPWLEKNPESLFVLRMRLYLAALKSVNSNETALYLERVLRLDPKLVTAVTLKAMAEFADYDYAKAHRDFTTVINLSPGYLYAWRARAQCSLATGNPDEAMADYNKVIALMPQYYEALIDRSALLIRQAKMRASLPGLFSAIQCNSEGEEAFNNLGLAYFLLERYDSARYYLNKATRINPRNIQALYNLANVNVKQERYADAVNCFTKCLDQGSEIPKIYVLRGEAYYYNKQTDLAIADFRKAVDMNESLSYSLYRLGDCSFEKKDYEKALEYYNESMFIRSDVTWVLLGKAAALHKLNNNTAARKLFIKVLKRDTTNSYCSGNLGWTCYLLGDYKDCIRYSEMAIRHDTNAWYARYNIALAKLRLGKTSQSRQLYEYYTTSQRSSGSPVNPGAITDLQDLIREGILVSESKQILLDYFGVK